MLFGVMETRLQQLRQIVMFRGAYQPRHVGTRNRTRARVQVIQQYSKRVRVEFNDGELGQTNNKPLRVSYFSPKPFSSKHIFFFFWRKTVSDFRRQTTYEVRQ